MAYDTLRIGIVGLGENTRLRHVPGLRALPNVEIVGVCNRRRESTEAAARELEIPRTYERWENLVADDDIDAVVIGAWPYLHCPVTLAALKRGKHVLCEARMAMNAAEAHAMLAASRAHPQLVCQIVPSPLGFRARRRVEQMLDQGFLGELREVVAIATSDALAEATTPLSWRQAKELSGLNMLALGIVHETAARWVGEPVSVMAQAHAFVARRLDPATGMTRRVGTPDSVQVIAQLAGGARALYHLSGAIHHGPGVQIHLYGSDGSIKYEMAPSDRLLAGRRGEPLHEIDVPPELQYEWRVEADFIAGIREGAPIELTDFATGVRYMEFTEAVARSAATGRSIELPLDLNWEEAK